MFAELSDRLSAVLSRLTGRGVLTEAAIAEGLEELRQALLAADVGFDVARAFTDRVREKTVGLPALKTAAHAERDTQDVVGIVRRGIEAARHARARTVLVDTAGRLQIDEPMMEELKRLKGAVKPHEILLVADGMSGQDAVRVARGFHE